jgi:hypothetical protein
MTRLATTLASLTLLALAGSAHASIASTSGQFTPVAPPPSLALGAMTAPSVGFAIDEQQDVFYAGPVDVLAPTTGTSYTWTTTAPGPLNASVRSHIVHVDYLSSNPQTSNLTGTVTFAEPIVALIFLNNTLDFSDATLGNAGTIYPTGLGNRGFAQAQSGLLDTARLLDAYTISLTMGESIDQIRVLTQGVPTPGPLAAIGVAALSLAHRRRRTRG